MTTLTIALIVCTALCLAFKESRGLGIAGVLALILIAPLLFGALVVAAGLIYYVLLRRSRSEYIPKGNLLPPDEASRRRNGLGLFLIATGVAGVLAVGRGPSDEGQSINGLVQGPTRSTPEEPGGSRREGGPLGAGVR